MTWLALGGLALVLVMGALSAFANAPVRSVKAALAWIAGGLGVVLLAALLFSGRGLQAIWVARASLPCCCCRPGVPGAARGPSPAVARRAWAGEPRRNRDAGDGVAS